jgi:hypothetical protein
MLGFVASRCSFEFVIIQFMCLCKTLSSVANAVTLGEHAERSDQDSLRAFLSHGSASPALPTRPFPDRGLHPDDVPYARSGRRAVAAQRIEGVSDALAGCDLGIGEIANIMGRRW